MSNPVSPHRLAFVALGSNLGDARGNIENALRRLQELSERPLLKSSLRQTEPIDCPPDSPPFINAVAGLVPPASQTPEGLLRQLQLLEKQFGRRPKKRHNDPRPLDLDLISFGNQLRDTAQLTLPHPRAHQRRFVLEPMAEIAPTYVLPGQTKTVEQLLNELPDAPPPCAEANE